MGASSSTVTAGIKDQVDGRSNAINQLADVTGNNGGLALLAKEALKLKDTRMLDEMIIKRVRPLLYNDGDGEMIPMEKVLSVRHKERTGNVFNANSSSQLKKFVCWRLDSRGAVGETLLHVCFLCGLTPHMKLLAQRLIYIFPKIINDFYICEEYYGETALHMGIVNEDPEIVRFLLKCGAAMDVRCTGKFFTCDDQKESRVDSPDFEHCLLNRHTNYTG
ncbi:Protein OCR-4 [Aphelenchoides avenae]|nr:Protein OCR-4 [Aphelenchus avenae]